MTRVLLASLTSGTVSSHFYDSVCDLLENPLVGVNVKRVTVRGGPLVAHQRNVVTKHFLLNTTNDCLLFVDSDIKFEPLNVHQLLKSKKDIVGARYYGYSEERNQTYPTWQTLDNNMNVKGLIECKYVGMGFTLISRRVVAKLGVRPAWPFGGEVINNLDAGEDITFCHRAREAGFSVFLNSDARVYHVKPHLV